MSHLTIAVRAKKQKLSFSGFISRYGMFYVLLAPALVLTLIFAYIPLPGVVISFMKYNPFDGFRSPWLGLENYRQIFTIPQFSTAIINTLRLSVLMIAITFPCPIILALLFNELRNGVFKKIVRTVSYLPNFLSWISIIGMAYALLDKYGTLNNLRALLLGPGAERVTFVAQQSMFVPSLIILNIWKNIGWGSIVYLASMASIDEQLYEAATIDGAGRWKQTVHITIPAILPMVTMFLILSMGNLFSSNFELVFGMQNAFINFETIDTIVYKHGIMGGNFSLATAMGFMQGLVALVLVLGSNFISKRLNGLSIL
jgi:putative aldouronate transport system permease protein